MEIFRCGSHTSGVHFIEVCAIKGFLLKMTCSPQPEHDTHYLEYLQLVDEVATVRY